MFSSKGAFLTLVLNKSNTNEHVEYHGIFIPFKDKIYLKQGSHISLLLDFNVISSCRRATRNFSRQGRFRGIREIRKTFSQKYTKKKPRWEKEVFSPIYCWNDISNEKFHPKMHTIRAFFPKIGCFFWFF